MARGIKNVVDEVEHETPAPKQDAALARAKARGFSGKCYKIKIFGADGESQVLQPFHCGTLGPFSIRRNQEVIVPEEVVEALRSSNETTRLACNIDDLSAQQSGKIKYWEEPAPPRFPFQIYAECSWKDYEDFKASQKDRPVNPN
jgi:hypothetical protein